MKNVLQAVSRHVARFEKLAVTVFAAAIVVFVLLNVLTRAFDVALFWVDELAVYCLIWMALIGASLLLHERGHIAVTLLRSSLNSRSAPVLDRFVDGLVLMFCAGLLWMCLAWFDPLGYARHGFDASNFAASTYNFIYQEPTNTLGIQKFWVWMVVPLVALTMTVHCLAALLDANDAERR